MTRPPAYHPGNFLMKNMNPTNSGLIELQAVQFSDESRSFGRRSQILHAER